MSKRRYESRRTTARSRIRIGILLAATALGLAACSGVVLVKPGSDELAKGANQRQAGANDAATLSLRSALAAAESDKLRNRIRQALAGALLARTPTPPTEAEVGEAVALLETAAQSQPSAARDLAILFAEGDVVPQDLARAEALLRQAAATDASAALYLGQGIQDGRFPARAPDEGATILQTALTLLEAESAAGRGGASRQIAAHYLAQETDESRQKAERYLTLAIEQGEPSAVPPLADLWIARNRENDRARAEALLALAYAQAPTDGRIGFRLADLARDSGRFSTALDRYLELAAIDRYGAAQRLAGLLATDGAGAQIDKAAAGPAVALIAGEAEHDPRLALRLATLKTEGQFTAYDPAGAAPLLRQAAEAGHPYGAVLYARALREGVGGRQDQVEATRYLQLAADKGEPAAWRDLADAYRAGAGAPQDFAKARRYYLLAAERNGSLSSARALSELYRNGEGGDVDLEKAFAWSLVAAEGGSVGAMQEVADAYRTGTGTGAPADPTRALIWYERAAAEGSRSAALAAGWAYAAGRGVNRSAPLADRYFEQVYAEDPGVAGQIGRAYATGSEGVRDDAQAIRWLERAGASGDARAIGALARAYEEGTGVPADMAAARRWRIRAAALGDPDSMIWLGDAAYEGRFGQPDFAAARRWYGDAAKAGAPDGAIRLAKAYSFGGRVEPDPAEAHAWWLRAAEAGSGEAQFQVAMAYLSGIGVPADQRAGERWLAAARASGFAVGDTALPASR